MTLNLLTSLIFNILIYNVRTTQGTEETLNTRTLEKFTGKFLHMEKKKNKSHLAAVHCFKNFYSNLCTAQNHIIQTKGTGDTKVSTQFIWPCSNITVSIRAVPSTREGTTQTFAAMQNMPQIKR